MAYEDKYRELEQNLTAGEPDMKERARHWSIAIGLQDVDGLKPSDLPVFRRTCAIAHCTYAGMKQNLKMTFWKALNAKMTFWKRHPRFKANCR